MFVQFLNLNKLSLMVLGLVFSNLSQADIIAKAIPKIDDSISQSLNLNSSLIYDSNPALIENASAVWITRVIPRYRIQHNSNQDEQFLDMALTVQRSTDSQISLDRNDPKVEFGFNHLFLKGSIASSAGFIRRSTRISEFDDTGLVLDDGSRDSRYFNLNGMYQLSSRTSWSGGYSFNDTTFSGNNQLRAFTSSNLSGSINHQWNEKVTAFASVVAADVSRSSGHIYLLNPSVGLSWLVTPSLVLDATIGKSRVYLQDLPTNDGSTFSTKATYTTEKNIFNASLIRSVRPNGLGFQESDKVLVKWGRKIDETSDFNLTYDINKNNSINKIQTTNASLGYNKKFNNEWSLNLYFKNRERDADNINAKSNVVGFVLKYGYSDYQDEY